ncbi:FUN14 domain-containing protein 2 isoform X1 [Cygnus atratus]|uniref:FUN14 domain-containing protein 2 isoform X1 n=1 Tax=Cygnus atratus TaxID=8868 RepID=UPI0021B837B2|nr:FUN14 domain-containing protein 2 isoform X1 [Cygnus atratus]
MAAAGGGRPEDAFTVLELSEYAKSRPWWRRVFAPSSGSSAEKYNVATQLVIGGVTGWCTGFIFQKVGKLAATAVGGGFFLLQIANHTGYIKVDWKLVERDVNKAKQQLKFHSSGNKMSPEVKSRVDEGGVHWILLHRVSTCCYGEEWPGEGAKTSQFLQEASG